MAVQTHDRRAAAPRLGQVAGFVAVAGVAVLLLVYGGLALHWQSQPFLGVMYGETLTVQRVYPMASGGWPAFEAGVRAGDRIVALGNQELDPAHRLARAQLQEYLAARDVGDMVTVRVVRRVGETGVPRGERIFCAPPVTGEPDETVLCMVLVVLARFPLVDFLAQFGLSYLVAVAFLVLAAVIFWGYWRSVTARHVGLLSLVMAVLVVGTFDGYTTQALSPWLVPLGLLVIGGLMQVFFLAFPSALVLTQRYPWLRWLPVWLTALTAAVVALALYSADSRALWRPWDVSIAYLAASGLVFILGLVRRLNRAVSPTVRDQVAVTLVSLLLSMIPPLVWLISDGIQSLTPEQPVSFPISLTTPFLLIFPFGLFYAATQDRLPDTGTWLHQGIIYAIMGLAIALGYGLLVTGFAALTGSIIQANNPLVIAITVFLMALLFVPVRNVLERQVDRAYFRRHRLYQQRVETLAQELTRVAALGGVVEAIRRHLNETLAPTHSFLFFPDAEAELYVAHGVPSPETDIRFEAKSPLIQLLSRQRRALYLEPGERLPPELAPERARLAVLGAPVLLPLSGQDRLSGILAVGPRQSGRYGMGVPTFLEQAVRGHPCP
mgnify:CR=1 FL=1